MEGFVTNLPMGNGIFLRDCGHEACEPSHCFGPAVRDYFLLHVVRYGHGVFENKWGRHEVLAGQGFMIFPREVTVYTADDQEPWEYDWVGYSGDTAAGWTKWLGITQQSPVLSLKECAGKVTGILKEIYEDSAVLNEREIASTGGLYRLFAWIRQSAMPQSRSHADIVSERYYQRAYWHMEANYQRDLQISDVAAFVGISRSQLFRVFVRHSGMPPQKVLLALRLHQAETLLTTTDLPLKAVALSSGFFSAGRMGEVFRKEKGMTPTQYRHL
jgi:AraC-like DNA-binding protein